LLSSHNGNNICVRNDAGNSNSSRRASSSHPYIMAVLAEMDCAGDNESSGEEESDWEDLEDFIVCKSGRDSGFYMQLISDQFKFTRPEGV
jgi:hypothetical protein